MLLKIDEIKLSFFYELKFETKIPPPQNAPLLKLNLIAFKQIESILKEIQLRKLR